MLLRTTSSDTPSQSYTHTSKELSRFIRSALSAAQRIEPQEIWFLLIIVIDQFQAASGALLMSKEMSAK